MENTRELLTKIREETRAELQYVRNMRFSLSLWDSEVTFTPGEGKVHWVQLGTSLYKVNVPCLPLKRDTD